MTKKTYKQEENRLLKLASSIMNKGKKVYLPSKFWQVYSKKNNEQLRKDGFENIKIRQGLNYFNFLVFEWNYWQFQYVWKRSSWQTKIKAVITALTAPRYANFPMEERQRWLFVYYHCLLWDYVKKFDYKNLLSLEEPKFGSPLLVNWRGQTFTQDLLNSIIETYSMLEALHSVKKDPEIILEIGGGYGRNAYILKHLFPKSKIIMVDIVPGIILAQWYLTRAFPNKKIAGITDYKNFAQIKSIYKNADFIFLLPHQIEFLPDKCIDLFININSFHEMTIKQLKVYFHQINRLTHGIFYMKQWKMQNNEFDKIYINEYDYPVFSSWGEIFHREARVQSKFFESAYFIADK